MNKVNQLLSSIHHPALDALKDSLNDLAKQNLSSTEFATASPKKKWQYRYALALGILEDYQTFLREQIPDLESLFRSTLYSHIDTISPDEAVALPDAPSSPLDSDQSLFQKALELKLINRYYLTREEAIIKSIPKYDAELKALNEAKSNYEKQLKELENELTQLRSAATVDGFIQTAEIYDYGNSFITSLKNDIDKTISYYTAKDVLTETRGMIKELKGAITPHITSEARIQHQNKANDHAKKLVKLTDKRKDTESSWWKWALLVTSMVVITLAILALIAVDHGSFLGLTFSTGSWVATSPHVLVFQYSTASKVALAGSLTGITLGPFGALGALSLFSRQPTKTQEQGKKLVETTQKALKEEKQPQNESIALNLR